MNTRLNITDIKNAGFEHVRLGQVDAALFGYYVAFTLYSICSFIELTTFYEVFGVDRQEVIKFCQIIILFLLLFKFVSQRASFSGWLLALAVVLIGYNSWRSSGENWFFWLCLFVACSDKVRIRTLAAISLSVVSMLFVLTVTCCELGLIENRLFVRSGVMRFAYGFKHPNYLGFYLMAICIFVSTLRFGANPLPDIVLILVTFLINIFVVGSRSSAIMSLAQIPLLLVFDYCKVQRSRNIARFSLLLMVLVAIAGSLAVMVVYSPSIPALRQLNTLLSNRFSLAHSYYSMQPLTLFGSDFSGHAPIYWELGKPTNFIVDNAFCHILLRYGIIPSIIFFGGVLALMVVLVRKQTWNSLIFGLSLMLLFGIGETLGARVDCNIFLVAFGPALLFSDKSVFESDAC